MKKYDTYQNSGVEWLGEIPEHWELKKLKYSSSIYNGDSLNETKKTKFESDNLDDLAYISSKDIDLDTSNITYENGLRIPQNQLKYKVAPKESSLICIEGGSAGRKIAFSNQDVCFVNKLACVKAKNNVSSKFIYHTLKGSLFQTQFKLAMSGMIGGVAISSINNFYILNPPKEEQTVIANFLDDKTTKIDQAIAIKQIQIERLQERRQILIHKAVTRGLDENVKLKDSGVEWIGEIPEHWMIKRAKYLFDEINDRSQSGEEELLSVSHMTGVTPRSEKNVSMFKAEDYTGSKLCKSGDLIYNIMWAWMGALGISDRIGIVSPSYAVYRQKDSDSFNLWFIEQLLGGANYIAHYNRVSTGLHSSRLRFYSTMFFEMPITFPTKKEQDEIVDFLKTATTKIATAISLKEQEIDKLKEYKMSLIDGVVTGKVKVS